MHPQHVARLVARVEALKKSQADMRAGYRKSLEERDTEILRLKTVRANRDRTGTQAQDRVALIRKIATEGGTLADIQALFR